MSGRPGFAIKAVPRVEGRPTFTNDRGVPEIRIGVKAFKCMGASPPQDHPHIYLEMGEQETSILCPYCSTRFRFDRDLDPFDADPPESVFTFGDEAEGT